MTVRTTRVGFQEDKRSREELERDGYVFLERTSVYLSKSDHTPVWVELYLKDKEMVVKVLETPELFKVLNDLEETRERA
jgi:hypothetical protein